jgi:hypothetical protein
LEGGALKGEGVEGREARIVADVEDGGVGGEEGASCGEVAVEEGAVKGRPAALDVFRPHAAAGVEEGEEELV